MSIFLIDIKTPDKLKECLVNLLKPKISVQAEILSSEAADTTTDFLGREPFSQGKLFQNASKW